METRYDRGPEKPFKEFLMEHSIVDAGVICEVVDFGSSCYGGDLKMSDTDLLFIGPYMMTGEMFLEGYVFIDF
jgi:hypothetical protein